MKIYKNLYQEIYSANNLVLAYKKARKGKTKKNYVKKFEENFHFNIKKLHLELKNKEYAPKPLKSFILRDPKTRKISKSHFRDRIVHHALCNILEPLFDTTFIYDSCANRKEKGSLFAIKRLNKFKNKVTTNKKFEAFCFKADIKHYFREVDCNILVKIIKRKIHDKNVIWLIERILHNYSNPLRERERERETDTSEYQGMPLGNLTSQFFANVYLNELDYFVKHKLKTKYYIRYVDDFIILHKSKSQLKIGKNK